MTPEQLRHRVEAEIEETYFERHWRVFWPRTVAEALNVTEDEALLALSKLARDGKLRARVEFYDADGETVFSCEHAESLVDLDIDALDVDSPIETYALFFELAEDWRHVLDGKSERLEKKKRRQLSANRRS